MIESGRFSREPKTEAVDTSAFVDELIYLEELSQREAGTDAANHRDAARFRIAHLLGMVPTGHLDALRQQFKASLDESEAPEGEHIDVLTPLISAIDDENDLRGKNPR